MNVYAGIHVAARGSKFLGREGAQNRLCVNPHIIKTPLIDNNLPLILSELVQFSSSAYHIYICI